VLLDAYDCSIFGALHGKVSCISLGLIANVENKAMERTVLSLEIFYLKFINKAVLSN
jgi:hypothetical protein